MPIVLCQVFPSSAKMKRPSPLIKDVNARLLALVKNDPQVTPVDTWRLWADADGDAPIAEFPDLLHLNDAGYARWAAALRPVLESLGVLAPVTQPFTRRTRLRAAVQRPRSHRLGLSRDHGAGEGGGGQVAGHRTRTPRCGRS